MTILIEDKRMLVVSSTMNVTEASKHLSEILG